MRPSMATLIYPFCLKLSFIQDYAAIDGHFNSSILSKIIIYLRLCGILLPLLFFHFVLNYHLSKIMRPSMATLIHPFCLKSSFIQDYAAINGHFNLSILSEIVNDCM